MELGIEIGKCDENKHLNNLNKEGWSQLNKPEFTTGFMKSALRLL